LDNRAQAVVTASLARLNATRVVIAHRLSTVMQADRIVVLQDGRVQEYGRFEELMAGGTALRDLAARQLL
jgi:ABC-type bacteriocin/lantibiotic exporter with double-glycine peptidase domain